MATFCRNLRGVVLTPQTRARRHIDAGRGIGSPPLAQMISFHKIHRMVPPMSFLVAAARATAASWEIAVTPRARSLSISWAPGLSTRVEAFLMRLDPRGSDSGPFPGRSTRTEATPRPPWPRQRQVRFMPCSRGRKKIGGSHPAQRPGRPVGRCVSCPAGGDNGRVVVLVDVLCPVATDARAARCCGAGVEERRLIDVGSDRSNSR